MKKIIVRTLTGAVFVFLLAGATIFSPITFTALFAAAAAMTVWEFTGLVNDYAGASTNRMIPSVAAFYLVVAFGGFSAGYTPSAGFIPYLLSMIYLLVSELYLRQPDPLKNWAYAFASQIYIALPFALLSVLAFRFDAMTNCTVYEWVYPLSVFIFLWANDSGAYLAGSLLHKRFPARLFPRISPAKSWVGSVGGVVLTLVAASLVHYFFPGRQTAAGWAGLALTVCLFGTWGDLVESLLKRQLGIKDSGNMLPGHGGMLDRFDSALLAIPAAVLYFYTLALF